MKKLKDFSNKLSVILDTNQKKLGVLMMVLSLFGAVLETLGVSAILPFINVMLEPEKIVNSVFFKDILTILQVDTYSEIILLIGLFVVLVFAFKNVYFIFLSWARAKYACKIQRELSLKVLNYYFQREYSFFLDKNTSQLMQGVSSDVQSVYSVLNFGFRLMTDILTIGLIVIYMFLLDWKLAVAVMMLALFCLLMINFFFRKRMLHLGKVFRKYTVASSQTLIEAFQGIKEVLILRKQKYFAMEYEKNYIKLQKTQISQIVGGECPAYLIEGMCVAGLLITFACRTNSVEEARLAIPTLSAFVMGAFRVLPCLGRISTALNGITYAMPAMNSVYQNILQIDKVKADVKVIEDKMEKEYFFQDAAVLENITFSYSEELENVIEDVSIRIKKGDAIAFIGQSGSGKTTLADILLGLLLPQSGRVLLDNYNIREIPDTWSKTVGYVSQAVYLRDTTIRRNIAFGIPDEEINDQKVWECLEQAQMKKFVESLSKGIDTEVGDRGVRFSGGQRQRLAIARALYHEPQILILDEATSALDNETEQAVMEAIDSLQGKVTLLIVAHRLTTVKNCDVIYEIKDKSAFRINKDKLFKE